MHEETLQGPHCSVSGSPTSNRETRVEGTCQRSAVIFPPPNTNRHLVNVQLGKAADTRGHFLRNEARQFPQRTTYTQFCLF